MPASTYQTPLYVIGHKNPDTDAICSAIGEANLLQQMGGDAIPARCGELPERTVWVLKQAGIEPPLLIEDVRIQAGQMARRDVVAVHPEDTFLVAYRRMLASGVRSVPVIDNEGSILGILRFLDLLQLLLPPETEGLAVRTVVASLQKIATTLESDVNGCKEACDTDHEEELHMLVGASSEETVQRRLQKAKEQGIVKKYIVICGDRPVVHQKAISFGVRALIVTGGFEVDSELLEEARAKGVVVLRCVSDTASTAKLIRCSRLVRNAIAGQNLPILVDANEPTSSLKKRVASLSQEIFPVVKPGTQSLIGVLSKSDLIDPPKTRLVLVDHNEFAQAVTGVEEAKVIEVIDHHRLAGDLVSRDPIHFLNAPVGSTSTLIGRKFKHRDLSPPKGVAMCLCAGIIADTLILTGPTTTDLDRNILEWLAEIAEIDPKKFAEDFFAVGSLLVSGSELQILTTDRKDFNEADVRMSIAQIEELGLSKFEQRRDELQAALETFATSYQYDIALLAVTDIANHKSLIIAVGDPSLLNALPFERLDANLFEAEGVVSRKKQIFPAVSDAIRGLNQE